MIVLDSAGAGALPDWRNYDEEPGNTLVHVSEAAGGLKMPNCGALGLGNILNLKGVPPVKRPLALYGKAPLTTCGKDTTAGHWEMAGIVLKEPFPVFPQGFPLDFISRLEQSFGTEILCNLPYSGTQVIEDYGEEHLCTKNPIVYTSADSVLQIACHESLYSNEELYALCQKARELCTGPYGVGRVIARPFKGEPHAFIRTKYRRDFSLQPPEPNWLTALTSLGIPVTGVGKISDIFGGCGITESYPVKGNSLCINETLRLLKEGDRGLFFVNLVDFDMLYGHRNDPTGYARALEEFDGSLGKMLSLLKDDDLLIITADHGNDPTTASTDHNREYVPVLVCDKERPGGSIGIRGTLGDLGATTFAALTGELRENIPGDPVLNF